jgi:threonine dehydrogenase-like Zn-dependent dehydrogenase
MGIPRPGFSGIPTCWAATPVGRPNTCAYPYADVGPFKIENGFRDEQVLFLTDVFPTGYMAAENGNIQPGDTVAVWGCGPVGQLVIQSAWTFNPARVIAIDRFPERLEMAEQYGAQKSSIMKAWMWSKP